MILSLALPGARTVERRWRQCWLVSLGATLLLALPAWAQSSLARVGDPAPAFTLQSIDGRNVSLADFRGRYVVLEWWNSECFAINTHYGAGAMQAAQRRAGASGTVWLSIDSTHSAHPSFVDARRAAAILRQWKGGQSAMLPHPRPPAAPLARARVTAVPAPASAAPPPHQPIQAPCGVGDCCRPFRNRSIRTGTPISKRKWSPRGADPPGGRRRQH